MKINLENIETDLEIETDICIIGGGVAGQTLASELVKSKLKVSMVESGGEDFRRDTQSLTQGKNLGLPYYDLETTRLRICLLYTSPSPRDRTRSRMPSSA